MGDKNKHHHGKRFVILEQLIQFQDYVAHYGMYIKVYTTCAIKFGLYVFILERKIHTSISKSVL